MNTAAMNTAAIPSKKNVNVPEPVPVPEIAKTLRKNIEPLLEKVF
jgi:hypothetical protein